MYETYLSPFVPSVPFLYPLKTSESRKVYFIVFWCFQGVEKGCFGNEWVNTIVNQNKNTQLVNFFHLPLNNGLQGYKFKIK